MVKLGEIKEDTSDKMCDDQVNVCGMMHLLTDAHFQTNDCTFKAIEAVYHNFTSIHKVVIALIKDRQRKSMWSYYNECDKLIPTVGCLITFCKCFLLKRVLEEDGITINVTLAALLAEIELYLLDLIKDCTDCKGVRKAYFEPPDEALFKRVCEAYLEPSRIYCYQLVISYDLMIEFLDHCQQLRDWKYKKYFINLKNYLELLTKDHNDMDKLLIAVETIAYEMVRFYVSRMSTLAYGYYHRKDISPEILVGVLKVLTLQSNNSSSNAPIIMSDELEGEYVKCIQENLLVLLKNKSIHREGTVKSQLWILHEGLSFLMHLIITYPPKHNSEHQKLSNIRLDIQALARNVGCVVYSCFNIPMTEEVSLGLFDLIEKVQVIKGEIIKTICCMVLRATEREPPKKDQLRSLAVVLKNLKEFMDQKPSLTTTWKNHENLVLFISYLMQNDIKVNNYTGDEKSSRNTFQLDVALISHEELKKILISAQVAAFNMSCNSLLRRNGRLRWWELYFSTKEHIDMHMCVGILIAFELSSTTPLNDKLLIAYGECVQGSLTELLRSEAFDMLTDQFNILNEGISFLVRLLISYMDEHHEKLSHFKTGFQELMRSVGSVICWSFNNLGDKAMQQSTTKLTELVEKMNLIIGEAEELLHLFHINRIRHESPKTNQLGSLNSILENWKELVECESDLIITWKDQFQMICENLDLYKSFIAKSGGGESLSFIMEAGNVAEYLLNTFSVGTCPVQCRSLWVCELQKVALLAAEVMEVDMKKLNMKDINIAGQDRSRVSAQTLLVPALPDMVVGFEVEMELIMDRLTCHQNKQLDIISIVGMPGIGKTTLARKAYEYPYAKNHFDVRAWCSVSQEYNKKELFLAIISNTGELMDNTRQSTEEDLSLMVHKQLTGRRYFIVLDDVWDINAFMELKRFFPDNDSGSRIILTSRNKEISSHAQCYRDIIEPGLLNHEQSWDVLERKVYNDGKCPSELCQIGKDIAKKCKGLPLALVVVGGVLVKGTQEREFWEQVMNNFSSYLVCYSDSQFNAALELSYEYLPDCLKPMYLYLGAFPEDAEIPTTKLMRLWRAEGFLQNMESTSIERQDEKCLMDLIDRSLVMVAKRRWDGRVRTCHVHDLLRDMCIEKAKEENFMQQIHVHDEFPDPVMYQRRLSILVRRDDEATSRHLAAYKDLPKFSITPPIYSLLFFHVGSDYNDRRGLEGIEPVISSLKLLKVLDTEIFNFTGDASFKDLSMLVHLRYVSLKTSFCSFPTAITRLHRLETLIMRNVTELVVPETIWELKKLRHVHISGGCKFIAPSESSTNLENLETLSEFCADAGEEEKIFRIVPGLKKLKCDYRLGEDYNQFKFPDFESLGKLESLTFILGSYWQKFSSQLMFPLTLRKLKIRGLNLEWSQMSMLKTLPNLEALILSYTVNGENWDMEDDLVFANLKVLKLQWLDIKRWSASASSENFPRLEKLVLDRCHNLVEIPSDLGEINTLQMIEVAFCNTSLEKQVKAIQEEQEDLGNHSLKFYYYQLPNLEALILSDTVKGENWDMEDDLVFANLKVLKLRSLDIKRWSASSSSSKNFPCLEKLVLDNCEKLEEIPSDLGDIDTLQMIEVRSCRRSLEKMVKEIQTEQQDLGNHSLQFSYSQTNDYEYYDDDDDD